MTDLILRPALSRRALLQGLFGAAAAALVPSKAFAFFDPVSCPQNSLRGYSAGTTVLYQGYDGLWLAERTGEVLRVTECKDGVLAVSRGYGATEAVALQDEDRVTFLGPGFAFREPTSRELGPARRPWSELKPGD